MKKLFAVLLVCLMLCGVLAACNTSTPEVSEKDDVSISDEDKVYGEDLPIKDLDGRVIRILCQDYNEKPSIE